MKHQVAGTLDLLAELEVMIGAKLFIGTFSSNVGPLVAVLRHARGYEESSAISVQGEWAPNRLL
jgi:hypothetical protein